MTAHTAVDMTASMTASYSSVAIANTFLQHYGKSWEIDHMKLQKLSYYAYGWWLMQFEETEQLTPLTRDGPEVWRYGPVFSRMYNTFKCFGHIPVTEVTSSSPFSPPEVFSGKNRNDRKAVEVIKWVWRRYGALSSRQLAKMAHGKGTAWARTAKEHNYRAAYNTRIQDSYILEEFRSLEA